MRAAPFLVAGVSLLAAAAVSANPGGSGGSGGSGGMRPSASAPQFDAAAEYRNGIELLKAQKFAQAKKSFAKVLSGAPGDANSNYLMGVAAVGLNDLKGAARSFERALKTNPDLVPARQDLAIAYAKLGERPKAEAQLAKLKESQAKCAATCKDAGELQSAITAVSAALGQSTTARLQARPGLLFESAKLGDAAYLSAVGLINEGKYDAAIASLEDAQTTFGAHPDILTYLGFANRKLGRFEIAETYYLQALAAAPEHRGATEYYGELMVERGDLGGARRMLAKLEAQCSFGCAEADELRRWIDAKRAPAS